MDNLLQQGIAVHRAGNRDEARKIFIAVVKQSPDSETAWGWMYQVSNNDKEKIHCLKQILRINPNSEKAKQMLDTFAGNDFPFELEQKVKPPTEAQKPVVLIPPSQSQQNYTPQTKTFISSGEMTCPHCQKEVSINAHKCPYCHSDLTFMMFLFNPTYRMIFIILFVFIGCPCLYLIWSIFR
jgi:hypothetical protein